MKPDRIPLQAEVSADSTSPGAVELLERLARQLHVHGCPAHQLEDTVGRVARRLGVDAQLFSTPTAVFAELALPTGERTTRLYRMDPGDPDLARLRDLDDVIARVLGGETGPLEAELSVRGIATRPALWGPRAQLLAFTLASGAAARFLGGGPPETVAGAATGLAVGLLSLALASRRESRRVFELVAAALAAVLALASAVVGARLGVTLSASIVTVAGLIVLVPGMTLTLAMTELATRNLVSGSARLAGAMVVLFTIGFGVAVGDRLGRLLVSPAPSIAENVALPFAAGALLDGAALLAMALAFTVLFRARRADTGWMLLASALAWVSVLLGSRLLGPGLGALAASFVVGLAGNLLSRRSGRPAALVQVPGLMLLVPGSLGLRSLGSLLSEDTLLGIQGLVDTSLTAVALATGLLLAHALAPPKRGL